MKTILEEALYQFNRKMVESLDFQIASYHSNYMDSKRSPEYNTMRVKVNKEKIKKSSSQHFDRCTAHTQKSSAGKVPGKFPP